MAKKFSDLTGDGKVTQADVLKGRGVFVSGSEVDGYASLLNEFELSESKAETKKELEQVKKRREAYIGDLESNADLQRAFDAKYKRVLIKNEDGSSRYYHVPREDMAMGSLMVAPEREAYGKGKLIKRALKALDGDDAPKPKEKIKTLEDGTQIDTEIQEEVRDFIGKLKTVDADDRKYTDEALTAQQLEDYLYDFINEVPRKSADGKPIEPGLHSLGKTGYDLTSRFGFFGALDDAVEAMVEANAGPVLTPKSRQKLINRMFMEGQRELEAEEKVAKAKRKEARKKRRAEARERAKENKGSLMMPVERETYGKGRAVKSAIKMIQEAFVDGDISEKAIKKAEKIHSELEADDFAGTGRRSEEGKRQMVAQEQGVTADEVDIIETAFARASGGGASESLMEELKMVSRALTTEPTRAQAKSANLGGTKETRESRIKAGKFGAAGVGVGSLLGGLGATALLSWRDQNQSGEMPSGFEAAFSKAFKAGEDTFEFKGKTYTTELEREQKGKGSKIIDIFERLVGPKTVAKKKKMVDEEQALREIQKTVDKDPQALEMLSDDDYMEVVSRLPQQQRANFGLDDVPVDDPDDILQMLMDMEPEEAAQNLQLFPSVEAMFEYAGSLDAKDARKFMNALSPEDKEIFAGELPEFDLGPREVKGHGGSSGVAILMPVEYEEPPKDTYNNISSKEEKEEVENMNSDGEMEEEYMDYVANEVLSQEEQDYLFKTLDKDDKLEKILDKVMLNATEFTGAGEVDGPGTGVSDSIPARLSDGEFVFTRKATDQIGADKLQKMMDDAEREFDQRKGKANGGQAGTNPFVNPEETSDPLDRFEMDKDNERDVERQMLYSSRMPSLMNR